MTGETTGQEIQLDNGEYTRIANAILDVFAKARFTAAEFRALHFLLRKTYGYQKKEDAISLSQWGEGTDSDRSNALRTLEALIAKNVIYRKPGSGQVFIYGFNKYIEQWSPELFEREITRANPLKQPTVALPPNRQLLYRQTTVVPLDNCCTARQQTVVPPDNKTVVPPDNNKRKKETLKDKTRGAAAKPKSPPKERDPNLDHPAVIAYRDICHLTANAVQRQLIAQAVTDCQKWRTVLTDWMASGWKPGNVPGMLDRYRTNGTATRSNGHGQSNPNGITGHNNQNRPATAAERQPRRPRDPPA